MSVYVSVYVFVYVHVYVYVCVRLCVCVFVCVSGIYVCGFVSVRVCTHVRGHAYRRVSPFIAVTCLYYRVFIDAPRFYIVVFIQIGM